MLLFLLTNYNCHIASEVTLKGEILQWVKSVKSFTDKFSRIITTKIFYGKSFEHHHVLVVKSWPVAYMPILLCFTLIHL